MPETNPDTWQNAPKGLDLLAILRMTICVVLLGCVFAFAGLTVHWPLVNDPAQIDYACFLMDHGMAPYKDLIEMNMPGIYMVNWSVMHTLGGGALAWRFFDLGVTGLAGLAMLSIAMPYDWLAGVFGGVLFALFHGRDGPAQAGQRDLIIAMLMLWAIAFLFESFRSNRVWLLFFCTLCGTAAFTIKPLALPFVAVLVIAACVRFRKLGQPISRALTWSVAGATVPLAAVWLFLYEKGSLAAFAYVVGTMLPFYARLGRASFSSVLANSHPSSLVTIVALGCLAVMLCWKSPLANLSSEQRWEQTMLLAGIGFGFFSYFGQGTGFPYHRYPMFAFLLLWSAIQLCRAARGPEIAQITAYAGLLFGVAIAPLYTAHAAHSGWDEAYNDSLAADLNVLGGQNLSGRVLCLTTFGDCHTTLYRLGLVQDSGLFYDFLVFGNGRDPVIAHTRQRVVSQLLNDPPEVIVLSLGLYPKPADGYAKLATWPEFDRYVMTQYKLYDDRKFSRAELGDRGYRLYVRVHVEAPEPNAKSTSFSPPPGRAARVECLC